VTRWRDPPPRTQRLAEHLRQGPEALYIAYVSGVSVSGAGEHLKVGRRYKVTISLGQQEVTRTVKLQRNTKESAVQKQLGS
jgi:hypothetical protein